MAQIIQAPFSITKMRATRVATLLISMLLSGCLVQSELVYDPDNWDCQLATKKRKLVLDHDRMFDCGPADNETLAIMCMATVLVATTTSAVVHGSVVVVGNTVHWLEKAGKCPAHLVKKLTREHNDPLLKEGGKLLEPEPEVEL